MTALILVLAVLFTINQNTLWRKKIQRNMRHERGENIQLFIFVLKAQSL